MKNLNKKADSKNLDARNMGVIKYFNDGGNIGPVQTGQDSTHYYTNLLAKAEAIKNINPKKFKSMEKDIAAAKDYLTPGRAVRMTKAKNK